METPDEYVFLFYVCNLSNYDIEGTLEDNVPVIKSANGNGAGKWKEEEGDYRYIRLEHCALPRSFVRKFWLLEDADAGGVTARCENGVLTVTVKKQPPPEKKPKSVQVAIA